MSLEKEFDEWYKSDEFANIIEKTVTAAYQDTYLDFLIWEKETKELVNRIYKSKADKVLKYHIWKKVSIEFGFAEKWEHRLSDQLSSIYPDVFSMGLDNGTEPDIINLVSKEHGLEFKSAVRMIGTKKDKNGKPIWDAKTLSPAWGSKGATAKKDWYKHSIIGWRNCPFAFSHDTIALGAPHKIMLVEVNPGILNYAGGHTAHVSSSALVKQGGKIISENPVPTNPRWYRK